MDVILILPKITFILGKSALKKAIFLMSHAVWWKEHSLSSRVGQEVSRFQPYGLNGKADPVTRRLQLTRQIQGFCICGFN